MSSAPVAVSPKACAQDSQCFIQRNHPGFLLLIINTIFINQQKSGASSWYFHPTESPGALGLEILPGCPSLGQLLLGRVCAGTGRAVGAVPTSLHGLLHPRECSHGVSHLHPHIQCSKRGFVRTSCPRFEDLQCRSCLQHVNFSKCKCIKFLLNLGIVLYRALGRGRKLDHVLNEAPQTQMSLLQQVTEACRDF